MRIEVKTLSIIIGMLISIFGFGQSPKSQLTSNKWIYELQFDDSYRKAYGYSKFQDIIHCDSNLTNCFYEFNKYNLKDSLIKNQVKLNPISEITDSTFTVTYPSKEHNSYSHTFRYVIYKNEQLDIITVEGTNPKRLKKRE